MNLNVFRKVSLERLSSPEQLDQLLRVTSPKSWISFIGVASIIVIAILWGILVTNIQFSLELSSFLKGFRK